MFESFSASNISARWCRPAGGAVFYGASSVLMALRRTAHRGVARGPQPQVTESAPAARPLYPLAA